jgi:hypothetical protein
MERQQNLGKGTKLKKRIASSIIATPFFGINLSLGTLSIFRNFEIITMAYDLGWINIHNMLLASEHTNAFNLMDKD